MAYGRNKKSAGVAHNWAHQLQSKFKKDTEAGSMYYEGKTIYSYGRHFPIAVIHEDKKRGNVTFFTTRGYSNTTSGHISAVRSACSHHKLIFCANPDEADRGISHEPNLMAWENNCKNIARNLPKAKKPEKYLEQIASERAEAQIYANYFKIKLTSKRFPYLFIVSRDGGNKASANELKRAEKARIKREQELAEYAIQQEAEFQQVLKRFREFKNTEGKPTKDIPNVVNPKDYNAAYLRYNKKSKRIETSKGIEIPTEAGRRFYKWLQIVKVKGCDGNCTQKILDYSVTYVNGNEFKVGCHTVQMSEADTIAKLLKW